MTAALVIYRSFTVNFFSNCKKEVLIQITKKRAMQCAADVPPTSKIRDIEVERNPIISV